MALHRMYYTTNVAVISTPTPRVCTLDYLYNKCRCGHVGRSAIKRWGKDHYWTCPMCLTMKRYPK